MSTPNNARVICPAVEVMILPAINEVIGIEGDYVNDKNDAGGATRWGVTELVARAHGYTGHMKDYPREAAVAVYQETYFLEPNFHLIAQYSPAIAKELFEIEVNCPPGRAATWLQRALKTLNDPKGTAALGDLLFPDPVVDGKIGGETADALAAYLTYRKKQNGESVLLRMINSQQAVYYIERAEKRVQNERFIFGWIANRVELESK